MKEGWSLIWSDRIIKRTTWMTLVILVFFIIIYVWRLRDLPPQLPLFYSLPRGNDQLGNPILIALLPIFSVVITLINLIVGAYVYAEEILLARILMILGSFITILLFITFIKIILAVS